jgi:hypothetical protein
MNERRNPPRRKSLKGARILMLDQFGRTLECVVRNVSNEGARLSLRTPKGVPDKFGLVFEADQSVRQCRVVWRRETEIGVAFLKVPRSQL